jgi:hypothetical protein
MPSIVQFTDLNLKQMRLEERENMEDKDRPPKLQLQDHMEDRDRTRGQAKDSKLPKERPVAGQDRRPAEATRAHVTRSVGGGDKENEEDRQTRMRVATIAALAEEIRRWRIVRGPGGSVDSGARTLKEETGSQYCPPKSF